MMRADSPIHEMTRTGVLDPARLRAGGICHVALAEPGCEGLGLGPPPTPP